MALMAMVIELEIAQARLRDYSPRFTKFYLRDKPQQPLWKHSAIFLVYEQKLMSREMLRKGVTRFDASSITCPQFGA